MQYRLIQRKPENAWFLPMKEEAINLDDYQVTHVSGLYMMDNEDDMEALRTLWTHFNRDDRPTAKTAHSLSVNDIVELDGRLYLCSIFGWTRIYESLVEGELP